MEYKKHIENEFTQLWEHYRHNENMRLNYLQYFITISLALYTAIGYLLINKNDGDINIFILFEILFLVYLFFSSFIYNSILKINNTLIACEKAREIMICDNIEKLINHRIYLNMDKNSKEKKNDDILSISVSSEKSIYIIIIFGFFALLLIDIINNVFKIICTTTFVFIGIKLIELILIVHIIILTINLKKSSIRQIKENRLNKELPVVPQQRDGHET
jgi:hypothetical protein